MLQGIARAALHKKVTVDDTALDNQTGH
jgi:hypothetical protein